jgi:hypothetical protein
MCTMISERLAVRGAAKRGSAWMQVSHAYVSYDHPSELPVEHALNIDLVDETAGPGARVAVELTREDALALAAAILRILERAEDAAL